MTLGVQAIHYQNVLVDFGHFSNFFLTLTLKILFDFDRFNR